MTERIPMSKRLRFAVLARDNFTCRYCGRQSDTVKLVVDHIIPVAAGGTNVEENLATSCETCNQGKAATVIEQHAANETDRLRIEQASLRLAQERREQESVAIAAIEMERQRQAVNRAIAAEWECLLQRDVQQLSTLKVIQSYARQHGVPLVCFWLEIAIERLGYGASDDRIGRYVSGMRKVWLAENP